MNRTLKIILKTAAGIGVLAVVLVVGGVVLVNSKAFQQRVLRQATEMLSEKLQTTVKIDSIDIRFVQQQVRLYGVHVADQQQRPMLTIGQAGLDVDIREILGNKVVIENVEMSDASALLIKPKGEPGNFQFVIDAFAKKPKAKPDTTTVPKNKKKMEFHIHKVKLSDISIKYNDAQVHLERADIKGRESIFLTEAKLRVTTDNHKPRKNAGKPKRGYFDAGHLDIISRLKMEINATDKDTIRAELTHLEAVDSITGIDIRDINTKIKMAKKQLWLSDVNVQQKQTTLHIDSAHICLPSKKDSVALSYRTGRITGTAYLKDISRAFAPVLSKFSLPLNLSLTMSGTDSTMNFRDVRVNTADKRLTIAATGNIKELKSKEKLNITFNVSRMYAKSGIKEKIISQFPVKRMMMKQLHNLGNISYTGSFRIIRKEERFWGRLNTAAGSLRFLFWLDERNKYVIGNAKSDNLDFGKVMEMKDLGKISASAEFKIDISKPRTAVMRRQKGGKLPIGNVKATVVDCSYKGIHVRNLDATVNSDGAMATGEIKQHGNYRDIHCSYSFTNTDEMHKLKVSDFGLKFHKISAEDKQAKRERKEQKKKEKRELREQKRQAKLERKMQDEKEGKKKGIKLPSLKGIFGGGGGQPQ